MDWIDSCIEDLKKKIKSLSLKQALGLYILIAIVGVVVCFISTALICESWKGLINSKYEKNYINMETQEFIYIINPTLEDKKLLSIINLIQSGSVLVYSIGAILITSHFYYKNKLQEPLYLLKEQTKYISRDDLSFSCGYESNDEMGEVCNAFDKMRIKLSENQGNMWSLMEEQRRINAAFAHDLRTPLTVIKGYNELLIKYYSEGKINNEKLNEILGLTNNQVNRLISFSETMKDLHTFEGMAVGKRKRNIKLLTENINEMVNILNTIHSVPIYLTIDIIEDECYYDETIIMEVIDNLISNAIRYANSKVEISIREEEDMLLIYVRDDGSGFTKEELHMAVKPYYTDDSNTSKHFGIGLTICNILCQKHGGSLHFSNSIHGGAIVCAEFYLM